MPRALKRGGGWAWTALALSVGAIVGALVAGYGTGHGWWDYGAGLGVLRYLFFAAVAGVLVGLFARFRRKNRQMMAVMAILVGLAFAAYLGNLARIARSVPAIHDATTNVEDPPQFATVRIRADNLDKVPDLGRPGYAQLPPLERWRAVHNDAYADLKTLRTPTPPEKVIEAAALVARDMGWAVASVDRVGGLVEATATTRFFRFKDDVAVRVRAAPGGGSLVDVRSVSRVGMSDLGMNANRIRKYLKALEAKIGAAAPK